MRPVKEFDVRTQMIFGTDATRNAPPESAEPALFFPGKCTTGEDGFFVDERDYSRHILLLGGSGCGKTNAFLYAVRNIRKSMTARDIAVVFDTKGEFYDMFYADGDYVIGNSFRFRPMSHTWNLYDEILADGWEDEAISMNARELSAALFHGRGSASQPFFCNAARDIFCGVLIHFTRQARVNPEKRAWLNNRRLVQAFRSFQVSHYQKIFRSYPDMGFLLSYFGDGASNQALGVFGELNSMLSDCFQGMMADYRPERSISMRGAVRHRGGKIIFIEYDLSSGETLTPIYRILLDQALKEALGRSGDQNPGQGAEREYGQKYEHNNVPGRLYVIADEFKLLPKLQHIDDALNYGRGLGVRVMAGIQSIDQLYDIYGRERGAVIAGGFGSVFGFHTNDYSSREYIMNRYGQNLSVYGYLNQEQNEYAHDKRSGHTIEEWDQIQLGTGQAFIGLGESSPFLFQFSQYQ